MDPIAALSGLASVALVGLLKTVTARIDTRAAAVIKPVQPWIALGLSIGLPILAQHTGLTVDPQAVLQSPSYTLLTLGARELYAKLKPVSP